MEKDIHNLEQLVSRELIQVLLPVLHVLLELLRILVVSVLDQVEQVVMVVIGDVGHSAVKRSGVNPSEKSIWHSCLPPNWNQ